MASNNLSTIKQNISTMIDKGAGESEIDKYLSLEGVTPEQLRGEPSPQASIS